MEQFKIDFTDDTIAAVSTPPGMGGISVVRISGPQAIDIVNQAWKGSDLCNAKSHTAHFGSYYSVDGSVLDECVATVFKAPASFTGENVVELGIHGSVWIQREILNDLVRRGIRIASAGEFTRRAFTNGKIDLAQAEGIADLIAASSKASHDIAINQTKGYFSKEFDSLRDKLIEFASLMELELDFSEEDVEFADRTKLLALCEDILKRVDTMAKSFSRGEVIKNGIPVVIAGIPNAGKSSLLNLLLKDDKAIVTDIPGTTRDIIEDTKEINGVLYRFIDTAGLRHTTDKVEEIGVQRAKTAIEKAFIVIWVIDLLSDHATQITSLQACKENYPDKNFIILLNKSDRTSDNTQFTEENTLPFSTITQDGYEELLKKLHLFATDGQKPESDIIITNARHYASLSKALNSLKRAKRGITNQVPTDLVAQDIREAISHLGSITGSITSDTLLHSIFSRFCIGK